MACASWVFQPLLNPATTSLTAASSPLRGVSSVDSARAKRIVSGVANIKTSIATTHLRSLIAALATLVVMFSAPRSFEELVHQQLTGIRRGRRYTWSRPALDRAISPKGTPIMSQFIKSQFVGDDVLP